MSLGSNEAIYIPDCFKLDVPFNLPTSDSELVKDQNSDFLIQVCEDSITEIPHNDTCPSTDDEDNNSCCSEPQDTSDVSKFIGNKWVEPEPLTPMDKLITMGFANRSLNSQLLEKYADFSLVLNELIESNGEGYHYI
jgi:hypothetical protein